MKFSLNVYWLRLQFPSPFVDFLDKYTYLPVKNNWNRNMAKRVLSFIRFHTQTFHARIFNEKIWHLLSNRKLSEHLAYELWMLKYCAKSEGNGNLEQTTCIYQLTHCKHLHYLWIADRAVLRLTHYNTIHVHCLRNWNGQLLS